MVVGLFATILSWAEQPPHPSLDTGTEENFNVIYNRAKRLQDSLNAIYLPGIDVRTFGALCDGTTDDRAAIQNAIDSLTAGGTVLIPPNLTCVVGAPGIAIASNVTLRGGGNSKIKASSAFPDLYGNSSVLQNYTPPYAGTGNSRVTIQDLYVDGTSTATRCVLIQGGSTITISGVTTTDPWSAGAHIDVRSARYGTLEDCTIIGDNKGLGINVLDDIHDWQITRNRIANTSDSCISIGSGGTYVSTNIVVTDNLCYKPGAYGLDVFGLVDDLTVSDNHFVGATLGGVQGNISGAYYPFDGTFNNNEILDGGSVGFGWNGASSGTLVINGGKISRNASTGLNVGQAADVTVTGVEISSNAGNGAQFASLLRLTFSGNTVYNNTGHGLRLDDVKGAAVTGNLLSDGSNSGIYALGLLNSVISSNVVKNFGKAGNASFNYGIQIGNGSAITASSNNVVSVNRCFDDQGTKTQDFGIVSTGNSDYNMFVMNITTGNKTGGLSLAGTHNRLTTNDDGVITFSMITSTPTPAATYASIWAVNVAGQAEIKVQDGGGNITQISAHNGQGEWVFRSENPATGKQVYINMEQLLHLLEDILKTRLIFKDEAEAEAYESTRKK